MEFSRLSNSFLLYFVLVQILKFGEAVLFDGEFGEIERVVGGSSAKDGMYPYTVALYNLGDYVCTASIISETAVLTAAHCVVFDGVPQPPTDFHAVAGNVNRNSPDATMIGFRDVYVHPDFDASARDNDVAILLTTDPIKFSNKVQKICIASPKTGDLVHKKVVAMGWGKTSRGRSDKETSDILKHVDQRVITNTKCTILYYGVRAKKSVMCACGLLQGICTGDSGGPLVYFQGGRTPVQVGVASFIHNTRGCGSILGPSGFSRVSSYTDFIMNSATGSVCVI